MPRPRVHVDRALVRAAPAGLPEAFAAIRNELHVPEAFPPDVLADAERAAAAPRLPSDDATDLPFVTIDPPGSTDLDQAMCLTREGEGYLVRYAIADLAAFIDPGSPLDREAHDRGETLYAPGGRTPLHPPLLSEGAASLLPGQVRPALLWEIALDARGEATRATVRRALVRSGERLDYAGVQASLDGGDPPAWAQVLREVGQLREARETDRGGVSLPIPEQEVVPDGDGYALELRSQLPVEGWNAQISLLTGMSAARIMLDGGVGVLRTLPPPTAGSVEALRRTAAALGVDWPVGRSYPELVRTLDPSVPAHAALLQEATHLMRGAGYAVVTAATPKDGSGVLHSAIAAPYAHVTAPLRRLVDRYGQEVSVALSAGVEVPGWVRDALDALPREMAASDQRASAYERACVDLVEAWVLRDRVGEEFDAVVVDVSRTGATVQLAEPAVRAHCEGPGQQLGARVRVRLVSASVDERRVTFAPALGHDIQA